MNQDKLRKFAEAADDAVIRALLDELHLMRAELHALKMKHGNDLAAEWDAGWCDRHLGTHGRDDNPRRQGNRS